MPDVPMRRRPIVSDVAEQIRQKVNHQPSCELESDRVEFISTGSTLLNLAASQHGKDGGWARGRIINLVGDGSSGKTLLALEACAQAFYGLKKAESLLWPKVNDISIVYNNVEGVMDMPIETMYGKKFVDAVEWLPEDGVARENPMTCEAFGRDLLSRINAIKAGQALVYVLDSVDATTTEKGVERMDKSIKTGKALDGSYGSGVERAKYFSSEFFGQLCSRMSGKDVTIFLISQVREKLDAMAFGEKYYRAGGKALDFYTHQVCWLAQIKKLTNEYLGQKRIYGVKVRGRFKRNKVARPFREADFDILFDYGVDNLASCVDYLTPEEIANIEGKRISRGDFVVHADENPDIEDALIDAVEEKWKTVEEKTSVKRTNRWGE